MPPLDVLVLGDLDQDLADLSGEVLRIKASLLYGDRVTVASHKIIFLLARMAARTRKLAKAALDGELLDRTAALRLAEQLEARGLRSHDANSRFILNALRGDDPEIVLFGPEALADALRERQGAGPLDQTGLFRVTAPIAVANYLRSHPEAEQEKILAQVGELVRLTETDLVVVNSASAEEINIVDYEEVDRAFSDSVLQAFDLLVSSTRQEHPLFTMSTRLALRDIRADGGLEGADFTKANRVELAARLIADIPSFPSAGVDEIIDIRGRVEPYLRRFRSAIADLEEKLGSDVLGDDFAAAVDDLKLRQVDPALEELRESLWDDGIKPTAARSVPVLATGSLGLAAAIAVGAPDLAGVAAVAAGGSTAVAKEFLERHQRETERRKNRLFLLFDLERQLKANKN
jgi:hypothetical protein